MLISLQWRGENPGNNKQNGMAASLPAHRGALANSSSAASAAVIHVLWCWFVGQKREEQGRIEEHHCNSFCNHLFQFVTETSFLVLSATETENWLTCLKMKLNEK